MRVRQFHCCAHLQLTMCLRSACAFPAAGYGDRGGYGGYDSRGGYGGEAPC